LDLQNSRMPLDVVTGKRMYTNMLIRALEVTTDRASENILSAVLTLREVIITSTTTTQVAPKSNMKLGANTSAVQNSGVKTPVQKNESILSRLSGFVAGG
ncbi:phage baseplate protein, partial [Klebsiella pneumoniae subsp. pneumoniae]